MNHFVTTYGSDKADRIMAGANIMRYGVSYLDDALGGILPNDLILLGARTGVGKTQLATSIALTNAALHKRVHFFALEAERGEIESRLTYRAACREYYAAYPPDTAKEFVSYLQYRTGTASETFEGCVQHARRVLEIECASLRTIYREKKFTVDDFVQMFEAVQHDTDLIIVDHLHYFDLDDDSENNGLKAAIRKIRSAALDFKKPVILLAHLRKTDRNAKNELPDIDDFYGHSDVVKIATNVILAARAESTDGGTDRRGTYLYIPKSRFSPEAYGYAGLLTFDLKTGAYEENYHLARARRFSEPELIGSKYEFPRWAKHAKEVSNLAYRAGAGFAADSTRKSYGQIATKAGARDGKRYAASEKD